MDYVFGPVPSRRLGQSLGIDPIPHKTCNWNCVYCQLGRSKPMVSEQKEYFPLKDILAKVQQALANHEPGEIDWITFVPDEVHLLQPTRPPAENWVQAPDENGLLRATTILGEVAKIVYPESGIFNLGGSKTLMEAVIGIITRHPMRETELVQALESWSPVEVAETLSQLERSGQAQQIERFGTLFWSAASGHYANSD